MATDFRVVTPADMGDTIVLGTKVAGKYDVDVSKLTGLPNGVSSVTLDGTTLRLVTNNGNIDTDLASLMPSVTSDVFLKNVEYADKKLKFTVGIKKDTSQDNVLEVAVADMLPVQTDGMTLDGNGTAANTLKVRIDPRSDNLLSYSPSGLHVAKASIQAAPARGVRLVNATGETVLGYMYATEE